MRPPRNPTLKDDAMRFDAALARLETALDASVRKLASMAHSAGFEDGVDHAKADLKASGRDEAAGLLLELEASRAREDDLQKAVAAARASLDEAMDDIRSALGPL
jgi:hypothetical protein